MKYLVLIFCFLITTNLCQSQSDWVQTNGPFGGSMKFIGQDWNGYLFAISENNYLYLSKDSAENWERISRDVSAIAFRRDSTYYTGNKFGEVFKFDSNFNLIKQIKSVYWKEYGHSIERIYLDSNSNIFLETDFWGNDFSTDDGVNWNSTELYNFLIDSENKYYKCEEDTLISSKDLGITWDTLLVINNDALKGSKKIIYDNYHKTITIFGINVVYVIKENNPKWEESHKEFRYGSPSFLILDKNGDIYAISSNYIGKSTNGGYDWDITEVNLPYSFISVFKKDNSLYLTSRYLGIMKYDLNNKSLEFKNQGINCASTGNLSKSKKDNIFVETNLGIFKSSNKGKNWEHLELPEKSNDYNKIFCSKFGYICK